MGRDRRFEFNGAAVGLGLVLASILAGCQATSISKGEPPLSVRAERELLGFIRHEMQDKGIARLAMALVSSEGRKVFELVTDEEGAQPRLQRRGDTLFRVGSISKLVTDLALMQLVEEGRVDLDAPVRTYLPDFRPANPSAQPITLRQLTSHRSGLVREPPVGNYFDASEPSLAATVASLNETALTCAPETRSRYSNAAVAVVGRVLEVLRGRPFEEWVEESVLRPAGMTSSSFAPSRVLRQRCAPAVMWALDGREFVAPTFQLGTGPAGNLYASMDDLASFLEVLRASGQGPEGRVLSAEFLHEMWEPVEREGQQGIGFHLTHLDGRRRVGHGGAIYGFSTQLDYLPDEGLGVAVAANRDGTTRVVGRIADYALRLLLAERAGGVLPTPPVTTPIDKDTALTMVGHYEGSGRVVDLHYRQGTLELHERGAVHPVRAFDGGFVLDSRLEFGRRLIPVEGGIDLDGQRLNRTVSVRPPPVPSEWQGLVAEYGPDHNILFIHEREGRLFALIEWFFNYPLEKISEDVYAFPDRGLYPGERLRFVRNGQGLATHVVAANVTFRRRSGQTANDETFRIQPLHGEAKLREMARAGTPPPPSSGLREPELVELKSLEDTIDYDIRYASTNNFMGMVFYEEPHAYLQLPAAEALREAQHEFRKHGLGIVVHDAYRPWFVTKMFWDATPEDRKIFVADPEEGSRHNRGCAVDLSLVNLTTGKPVPMVSGYDEFSERAFPAYPGRTSEERWFRELLRSTMESHGFQVYEWEWWHFDHQDWQEYPILNLSFDQLPAAPVSPSEN